tara:strand:+ start:18260 stop:19186 length:927 start_codon:yes stop_codon:yes gene_type:complete
MTLNVVVNNIVAVDSQVSLGQRTVDDVNKSQKFSNEKYHGILLGNGEGLQVMRGMAFVRHNKADSIDLLVQMLEQDQLKTQSEQRMDYVDRKKEEVYTKYSTVADPAKREELITREFTAEMDKLSQGLQQDTPKGSLYVVAYDKVKAEVRKFQLANMYNARVRDFESSPVLRDGSGGDLAGAYLATQSSGIDWETITKHQNIYLTALACAAATANEGVGGFMQIAIVEKESVNYLPSDKVNAAVKVCSKQVAGDISKREAMQYVKEILENRPKYKDIAKSLDITENDLIYTPTNLNQDVSKFNKLYQK